MNVWTDIITIDDKVPPGICPLSVMYENNSGYVRNILYALKITVLFFGNISVIQRLHVSY